MRPKEKNKSIDSCSACRQWFPVDELKYYSGLKYSGQKGGKKLFCKECLQKILHNDVFSHCDICKKRFWRNSLKRANGKGGIFVCESCFEILKQKNTDAKERQRKAELKLLGNKILQTFG